MANRINETTLRIRAQNLAKKDLRDVARDLDDIAESQKKNASGADLAKRSIRELVAEQKDLAKIAGELERRGGVLGKIAEQRGAVGDAAKKVGALKQELAELVRIKSSGRALGDIDKAIKNVEKQVKSASGELNRQVSSFNRLTSQAAGFGVAVENAAEAQAEIGQQLARVTQLQNEATRAAERHAAVSADAAARQREIAAEVERRASVERQAAAAEAAVAARRKAEQDAEATRMRELGRLREDILNRSRAAGFGTQRELRDTGVQFGPGGDPNQAGLARQAAIRERLARFMQQNIGQAKAEVSAQTSAGRAIRGTSQEVDRYNRSLDRHNSLQGIFADTGRKSLSVYQRLRGELLSLIAVYGGFNAAIGLVNQAVRTDQERQGTFLRLKVANEDDVALATRDFKFLAKEADRLGLRFDALTGNFANYKIAAKAAGLTNQQVATSYTQASESIAAMRLSADDADGVMRAFTQILSKNKVQAEELNQQLGDRLPGAVAKFAQSMVESGRLSDRAGFSKMLADGKVGIQDFLNFLEFYNKQTKAAVEENSRSLQANFNRLKNAYDNLLVDFARKGVSSGLNDVVNELIEKLKGKEGEKLISSLANGFEYLGKFILVCVENFDTLVALFKLFLGFQALKAVVGLGSGFITMATGAVNTYKAISTVNQGVASFIGLVRGGTGVVTAFNTVLGVGTVNSAGAAGTAIRGLISGPIAALLGIAATGIVITVTLAYFRDKKFNDASDAATNAVENPLNNLRKAFNNSGKYINNNRNKDSQTLADEIAATEKAITATRQYARALRERIDATEKANAATYKAKRAFGARDGSFAVQAEQQAKREADAQRKQLEQLLAEADAQSAALDKKRAAQKAAAAREAKNQPKITAPTATDPTGGAKDAERLRKKQEAEEKAAERTEEKKRDMADDSARAILEIDKNIAQARQVLNARTDDEIKQNLELRLREIDLEIQQREIALKGKKRDADAIGATDASRNYELALKQLEVERQASRLRAEQDAKLELVEAKQQRINDLIAARDARIQTINAEVQLGVTSEEEARRRIFDIQKATGTEIIAQIDALLVYLSDPANADILARLGGAKLIEQLKASRVEAQALNNEVRSIATNLGGKFAQGAATGIGTLIKGLTGGIEGVNGLAESFKNASAAFANFLADFLVGIAEAIIQAIILEAIMSALGFGSGVGGSANYGAAVRGALKRHNGGMMNSTGGGKGNQMAYVSPLLFVNAPKFHQGGIPGLKSDEVPAILKKNEEVLTRDDPRHALNGGTTAPQKSGVDLTVVNAIDSASVVNAGLNNRAGHRLILNIIRANAADVKRAIV